MSIVDKTVGTATKGLSTLAGTVFGSKGERVQAITIERPRAEVERFWHDPEQLSRVLGTVGEVRPRGSDGYTWVLHGEKDTEWETTLSTDAEGLRFSTADDPDGPHIRLTFAAAPADRGTEVTARVAAPVPGILTDAAVFKVLYRARALLQTGEIPTLQPQPAARESDH
ncbi:hypothetical protein [Nocardia jiangsuensis]|uniref:Polyketide cyclase/dehydrase/lipid transport protein n=1 Tax=Nocardia jiangsuensis TaxID=1691563 RepID=A0ABV8DM15_9NOCA